MAIKIIGISHKTAPIEIREKFFLSSLQQDLFLSELKSHPSIVESFILSTCNRTEIYINTIDPQFDLISLAKLLVSIKKLPFEADLLQYVYQHSDKEAVMHLLKVVSGLDSLVIGEKQILGQVKKAFEKARERGVLSKQFNILANITLQAGRKVQNETDISFGGSSVSWAAIMLAEQTLGRLDDKSVLIIGAGKMSKLAVGQISNKGFDKMYLMNRTACNAQALVEKFGGEAVGFCDIKEVLTQIDVAICSTNAPHYIIDFEVVHRIMSDRNYRPLTLIDISMPRNIDPKISEIKGVRLFHIDDLNQPIAQTMQKRLAAVGSVENILTRKLADFYQKIQKINELSSSEFQESSANN